MSDPTVGPPDEQGDAGQAGPRLPSSVGSNPSIVVPPTRHDPEPEAERRGTGSAHDLVTGNGKFTPLRSDPPPLLMPTWWLRYTLFGLLLAALVLTLFTEHTGEPGDVTRSASVAVVHLGAAACLVIWSLLSMHNAESLVPANRYQHKARGWLAALLWVLAFATPAAAAITHVRLEDRLANKDDIVAVIIFGVAVLAAFVAVWAPFRYCSRHAARIGVPHRALIAWFWVTLVALVGGLAINALGLRDMLAEDGLSNADRLIGISVVYGLPMLVFALGAWRALTVFDEVIDLRWRRWKNEWEQTLADFTAQPAPGPERSPAAPPA